MTDREAFERHIQAIEQRKPMLWSTVFENSVGRDPFPPHLEGQYFIKDDQKAWEAWQAAIKQEREACAKACEALRDDHCASTKLSSDKRDWCEHDDQCCDFVVGWNDAAAAIRARSEDREGS
jgi:hypothetical protein